MEDSGSLPITPRIVSDGQSLRSWFLQRVVDQDWWKRVWVVQEALLSPSAALMLGSCSLPWAVAVKAAKNFMLPAYTCCHPHNASMICTGPTRLEYLYKDMTTMCEVILSFQRLPPGTENELIGDVWMFRDRMSTRRRDKVYGVLGLIRSSEFTFSVDHRSPYIHVCRGTVIGDIRASGNLMHLWVYIQTRLPMRARTR